MTIYFTTPEGSYTDSILFSINTGNIDGVSQLQLTSKYNQHQFLLDLTIIESNDRYTEFATDYTDALGDLDISGIYDYTILVDDIEVETGLCKIINNKIDSLQNKTKLTSPNENGSGYVIY